MHDRGYRELLRRTCVALAVGGAIVAACYFWVDRPVAFFVAEHDTDHFAVFRWLTYPPPLLQSCSPIVLAVLLVYRAWRPLARWQQVLLVACISVLAAHQFRISVGYACGRYWPETWFDHNPSLIGTGTYGFAPFSSSENVGSFPSGHAARIFAFAGVWWMALPRLRALWVIAGAPMLASLVLMNYHFVGDVVAGSVLGGIIAAYAVQLADLWPPGVGANGPPEARSA
ncbi:MAG: phosphatase PAP2 family protein [Planctomycetota bacterium]|nr:MAG: phosphatase PAP2 family protein [Planctomycetota bacterium]